MRLLHSERTKECAITAATVSLELHHVLPRSQGGDDMRANLVFLRNDKHALVTANDPATLKALGEHIREHRPDTVEYLRWKLGERATDWMRRRLLLEDT
jgi:5-methylcytosine-specific restriction endonuclease McrA